MSISKTVIHDGLFEIRDYLESVIPDVVFDITNNGTIGYFLSERYNNESLICLIEFTGFDTEAVGKNTDFAHRFVPRINVQVFSTVLKDVETNFKWASETIMLIIKHLTGYQSENLGKIALVNQNTIPADVYDYSGNLVAWAMAI
ncbi:MAG: hypothetical protein EOM11_06915, partial [Erysipelotrichia bacterium]|nr:hypothetical protein [Erysipelotrichia bacterium]